MLRERPEFDRHYGPHRVHQAVLDSTLAMMLAAQARGWTIHYGQLQDIWLREGQAIGRLTRLQVAEDPQKWFELGETRVVALAEMDVILMRKDPPFDMQYIFGTYILQRAEERGALVVNGPQGRGMGGGVEP